MKRSVFKKKTLEQVIASRKKQNKIPKKKKKSPIRGLKIKLWELCKEIIRLKYGNTCFTCGKTGLVGSGWHTGHFIASSVGGAYLRYNLNNLRPQCYYCNINLGGNGAMFYKKMVEEVGQDKVDQLFHAMIFEIKADEWFYRDMIQHHQDILHELSSIPNLDKIGFII